MKEYHKLKKKASKKTAGLGQQLMRLEQEKQTSEQSLEQVKMKKTELEQRHAQLKEQEYVCTLIHAPHTCTVSTLLSSALSVDYETSICALNFFIIPNQLTIIGWLGIFLRSDE